MALARPAPVFRPADPPRHGWFDLWCPDEPTAELPAGPGTPVEIEVARPEPATVPARRLSIRDTIAALTRLDDDAHPAARFWAAATTLALHLIARGRLLPGASAAGSGAWRIGPFDVEDMARVHALAAAMPAAARAVPIAPGLLPDAVELVRDYLDAVADTLPRTPAAAWLAGPALGGAEPVALSRAWADELAEGVDAGVRVALVVSAPDGDFGARAFQARVRLRSLADPTRVADAAEIWAGTEHGFGETARVAAMVAVRRAAQVWAPLEQLLDRAVPDEARLIDADIDELLSDAGHRLAAAGVEVHWPAELCRDLTSTVMITSADERPAAVAARFAEPEPFPRAWRLVLDGDPLTDAETAEVAAARRPVARLRDRWVLVEPEHARRARDRVLPPLPPFEALRALLIATTDVDGERVGVRAEGWLAWLRELIADPADGPEPLDQPDGLHATLREYQARGVRWLTRMTGLGFGGCLADDMGLGKTVMVIGLHLARQADPATAGPTLVVCPASLLGTWEREIARFAPGVGVRRYHGSARETAASGFVLTTYGTMRVDAGLLAERPWALLVADEAQHVKNRLSGTARALRAIPAAARVALTGTPVENALGDLWSILDWTTPGLLGDAGGFRAGWTRVVEVERDPAEARRLAALVRPFLLRRRKSDPGIAPELPPKTETDQLVSLTPEQAALYHEAVRAIMREIRASTGIARHGLVLKLLTALKQICNHPAHYRKETDTPLAGRSGKLDALDELLATITAEGGAALVFTQYVRMAKLLQRHLTERGVPAWLLHGGTPVARREQLVRGFQDGAVPVFLLSLKAAGTGLTLTRADHVIHFDRWWNPAVEDQATDRAHRIGQDKPVQVHRLIAEGTLEDRIAALLESKRDLAEAVLAGGETAFTELSDAELAGLVELRSEP
ncbi:DEAD/DEAH box helicase [Actinokineospora sp. NBRC 105648]|uniref:DEAD/DEAH box helicase n=1 Tax=Actinokineospora sp. NBRC 105648 TaxID=3032206 RepID=UPI0024A4D436|nr:DEAD/DEAH box helicase [Actinokineospora sp. NBRC 105648]GLZ41857.1 helicase SNF2 [Actinokineospora sp. NBRC 105648]